MKKKKNRKATPPAFTLEPYTIAEWNYIVLQSITEQMPLPLPTDIKWLETKNGTLWPHKVVRDG